jgi:hypothetical protein
MRLSPRATTSNISLSLSRLAGLSVRTPAPYICTYYISFLQSNQFISINIGTTNLLHPLNGGRDAAGVELKVLPSGIVTETPTIDEILVHISKGGPTHA